MTKMKQEKKAEDDCIVCRIVECVEFYIHHTYNNRATKMSLKPNITLNTRINLRY